jgi:PAS domain-containing protein
MSTNYYFRETDDHRNGEKLLNGVNEIHIGQYAASTCLLMRNDQYYQSVEEMEAFYRANSDRLIIVDECERILTWDQLYERLLSAPPRRGHRFLKDEAGFAWSTEEFC